MMEFGAQLGQMGERQQHIDEQTAVRSELASSWSGSPRR
jgi:hypothetical protein